MHIFKFGYSHRNVPSTNLKSKVEYVLPYITSYYVYCNLY